jgi:GMP synthase-like glutamine amidotransferase
VLPAQQEVDILIVMGGAMSVNDEERYPWLIQEKQWIKKFIELDKPVIGLCLGGQLIANCLGAVVHKNETQELGWWPIRAVAPSQQQVALPELFKFPDSVVALSWHLETFELPPQAVLLAESAGCARQAYQLKHNVIGFQFHPEATPHSLALYLLDKEEVHEYCGPYVQTLQQLMHTTACKFEPANQLLERATRFVLSHSGLLSTS